MKFDHVVKHNGVTYPAGAEVPEDIPNEAEQTEDAGEEKPKRGRKPKEA